MRRRRRRNSEGFTLIELLIAIFILAVGLVFVFSLFPVGIYSTRENIDDTQASLVAQSVLSRLSAARITDRFDTADWAVLANTSPDVGACLRTPQERLAPGGPPFGFTRAEDLRDTDVAQYGWFATYARPDPSRGDDGSDTNPATALDVRVAVIRMGTTEVSERLAQWPAEYAGYVGRLIITRGSAQARLVHEDPQNGEPTDRRGFVPGNFLADLRSGRWYRIVDIRDTGDGGPLDVVDLARPAEYDSNGRVFANVRYIPGVIKVLDGRIWR
jgi:prepilin-type N-terminal cleavage/methylation domain-containing protein